MKNDSEQPIIYGFQKHLSSEFPSQIIIDITEFCNLACRHCPQQLFTKGEAFAGRHLDPEIHKKMVDEVGRDGKGICRYLRYAAQGETLLHPQLVEMIAYASKNADARINVTTNGTLLTREKAILLIEAGVDVFDISIDAFSAETYAKVRAKGDLNVTRANVLGLIDLVKKNSYKTKVVVSFVEQPENTHEVDEFERFWNEAGVDFCVIRRIHSCSGAIEDVAERMKRDNEGVKRKPCLYPWERLVLSPTGQIGFCPADWEYKAKIANLKDFTIKEIWQGEFMNKLREAHLNNDFSSHEFCGQCPDWSAMRWPDEGRSYSDMMKVFSGENK